MDVSLLQQLAHRAGHGARAQHGSRGPLGDLGDFGELACGHVQFGGNHGRDVSQRFTCRRIQRGSAIGQQRTQQSFQRGIRGAGIARTTRCKES